MGRFERNKSACERYEGATLPPDLRSLPLVFEAYATGGHLLAQERAEAGASDDQVRALIDRTARTTSTSGTARPAASLRGFRVDGVQFGANRSKSLGHDSNVVAEALEPHVRVALLLLVKRQRMFPEVANFGAKSSLYPRKRILYSLDLTAQVGIDSLDLDAQTSFNLLNVSA